MVRITFNFTAMDDIENFLRHAKYPEGLAKGEKANFRRRVNNNYKLEGGQLYYKKAGDNGADTSVWKMCVRTEEEKGRILKSCHEGLGGGHFGRDKTVEKICSRFYWKNMTEDIRSYVLTCQQCQRMNPKFQKSQASLHPVQVPSKVWSQAETDYWIHPLDLRYQEKLALLEDGMLTDRHMHAVNILMKEQFPDLDGLHSTLLVQSSGFPEISSSGGFMNEAVQMVYDEERMHWIATSYQGGEVRLFDSCYKGKITPKIELQLCQLYKPLIDREGLLVSVVGLQQQSPGTLNCGPLSIAAAYHTAAGDDIGSLTFDSTMIRQHLALCFEDKRLSRFPMCKRRVPRARIEHLLVEVNCVCKRPDSIEDMVACDGCNGWWHYSCAEVQNVDEDSDWFCNSCQ